MTNLSVTVWNGGEGLGRSGPSSGTAAGPKSNLFPPINPTICFCLCGAAADGCVACWSPRAISLDDRQIYSITGKIKGRLGFLCIFLTVSLHWLNVFLVPVRTWVYNTAVQYHPFPSTHTHLDLQQQQSVTIRQMKETGMVVLVAGRRQSDSWENSSPTTAACHASDLVGGRDGGGDDGNGGGGIVHAVGL